MYIYIHMYYIYTYIYRESETRHPHGELYSILAPYCTFLSKDLGKRVLLTKYQFLEEELLSSFTMLQTNSGQVVVAGSIHKHDLKTA